MIIVDLALARRLEGHEAWSSVSHIRTQAERYPATGAATLAVAGGSAVFGGLKSPLSQAYGLGLSGPVSEADLDQLEAFYQQRGMAPAVQLCPLADDSLRRLLAERGYTPDSFMNVYARPITPADEAEPTDPPGQVRVAAEAETRQWFTLEGAEGEWAEPDGLTFMTIRATLKPGGQLHLLWRDGQPIGGGALEIHDGVAALMAASTLPAFRRQGVQSALLRARLAAAARAGCDLALVHTVPGTDSARNVRRAGFELVYLNVKLIGPPPTT
jgi:GNAT superfamily N-acetyltransferase